MRVLMLSKACIVGIYQRKLEEIARLGVDLTVVVPPSWRDERGETPLERSYTAGYRLVANPIRYSATPVEYRSAPPGLGRDTVSALQDWLDCDAVRITELLEQGAIAV